MPREVPLRLRPLLSPSLRSALGTLLLVLGATRPLAATPSEYTELISLFRQWRIFQQPERVDGVPDYRAPSMARQHRALATYQRRLSALDTTGWTIPQQVDYQLVRAEMAGLEFDHRVLRPWANNPAFYVTVFDEQSDQPAREGPFSAGGVELWQLTFPLSTARADTLTAQLRIIPPLLAQARRNLIGNQRDLWMYGIAPLKAQREILATLSTQVGTTVPALSTAIAQAMAATDTLVVWLEAQAPTKTGASGVGIANYDWYLKHVQLVPFTWADEVTLMQRELARAHAFLALEEQRNAALPLQTPISSAAEHARRFDAGVMEYMGFLRDHQVLTIRDYLEPALRAKLGTFTPGPREFFTEVDYRDPEVMRTHGYHWFDLARMTHEPHPSPIRRGPLLYNLFNSRTEGHATGWEEMMLQAGMFDARPRSRELIYILLAQRAARALGDLRMHANQSTIEQAATFAAANTPRGWLRLDGRTVRFEQHLYLQQPGYGTSYVIGKMQIERLLMARRVRDGDRFVMRTMMDAFDAAGLIPASLLEWELTGTLPDDVRRMLTPR